MRGAYKIRGLEVTQSDVVGKIGEQITMASTSTRPDVILAPFKQTSNIRMTRVSKAPRPITADEAGAYEQLPTALEGQAAGLNVEVIGVIQKAETKYSLEAR